MRIDLTITPAVLRPALEHLFEVSAGKIRSLERRWDSSAGTAVFTWDDTCLTFFDQ